MARPTLALRRRLDVLTVVVVVVFAVLAALVASAVYSLHAALATSTTVVEPAAQSVSALDTALIDQETGQRGYLITGHGSYLAPYAQGQQQEQAAIARLRDLLAGRPVLLGEVAAVEQNATVWRRDAAVPEIEATQARDVNRADQFADLDYGRQLFEKVRQASDRLQSDLRTLRTEGEQRLQAAERRLEVALGVSVALSALLLALSRRYFVRWIEEPVRALSGEIQRVRTGGPGIAISPDSPPELAALGADIERMRATLAREIEHVARANEALRQQGPAVLALRKQLRPAMAEVPTLIVAGRLEPAEGVLAGDWYDVLDLGEGRWAAVVVDVSGHGAGAGILAVTLKTLLVAAIRDEPDLGTAFQAVARNLDDWEDSFATAVAVAGGADGHDVCFASAGHPPAVLCRRGNAELLEPTGPLLSSFTAHLSWTERTVTLAPGDRLVLYTDGVVESRDSANQEYGEERLAQLLSAGPATATDPAGLIEHMLAEVREFSRERARDDRTLVVLEREASVPEHDPLPAQSGPPRAEDVRPAGEPVEGG